MTANLPMQNKKVIMIIVSKNIYKRTYGEQVRCDYEDVPLLKQSPVNKIYETRAKFLESGSTNNLDELAILLQNPTCSTGFDFEYFKTDLIINEANVKGRLEFYYISNDIYQFHFNVRFGKVSNKVCLYYNQLEDQENLYIENFLNSTNSFGELGIANIVMSILKSLSIRLQTNLKLTCGNFDALDFYAKEGFKEVPDGDYEMVWKWNREKLEQELKKAQLVNI